MTSGDIAELRRGQAVSRRSREGNLALLGDVALMREVHDLLVFLNKQAGKGLEPEHLVRRVEIMGRVATALDEQEQRVLRGETPLKLSERDAPELFDAQRIASRMDLFARPANIAVRLAMWILRRFYLRRPGTG